jgi:hypothetical protein
MVNVTTLPNIVNQHQKAVVSIVATAAGANTIALANLKTDATQTVSSAPIMGVIWSGTWTISRPATNGLANTILALSGTGDIAFNRDYAFNYSVNSTGTITATAGGAGSIIFELRKESTDIALA